MIDGPFWGVRGDAQAAQVAAAVLRAGGVKASIADEMLDWNPPPPKMIPASEVEKLLMGG